MVVKPTSIHKGFKTIEDPSTRVSVDYSRGPSTKHLRTKSDAQQPRKKMMA